MCRGHRYRKYPKGICPGYYSETDELCHNLDHQDKSRFRREISLDPGL